MPGIYAACRTKRFAADNESGLNESLNGMLRTAS
jgi:hypothetical protein